MPDYHYLLYGLIADSDLELPEVHATAAANAPDLRITLAPVDATGLADAKVLHPNLQITSDQLWLQVPGVARYLIADGREIRIDAEPGADANNIRLYLLGSALGALLFQRELLVMHGNAVRVGNGCAICVGQSGAGKSTLAGTFFKRGYQLLADDVVPISADGQALAGFPRIKLWQDAADRLGISTTGLRRIRPDMEKFDIPLGDAWHPDPLPVRWLYVLRKSPRPGIHIEPIEGMDRLAPLKANTYRVQYMKAMDLHQQHLTAIARLARQIRLVKVWRCEDDCGPERVADAILADIAAHPA